MLSGELPVNVKIDDQQTKPTAGRQRERTVRAADHTLMLDVEDPRAGEREE
jgi:hypothetical protein